MARKRSHERHLIANALLDKYQTIFIDDLDVQGMISSLSRAQRHQQHRRALNRAVYTQGWNEFARILDYKAAERGNTIVRVDPANISRICPKCDTLRNSPPPRGRVFRCGVCGYTDDVDVVAARNVLKRGLACAGPTGLSSS